MPPTQGRCPWGRPPGRGQRENHGLPPPPFICFTYGASKASWGPSGTQDRGAPPQHLSGAGGSASRAGGAASSSVVELRLRCRRLRSRSCSSSSSRVHCLARLEGEGRGWSVRHSRAPAPTARTIKTGSHMANVPPTGGGHWAGLLLGPQYGMWGPLRVGEGCGAHSLGVGRGRDMGGGPLSYMTEVGELDKAPSLVRVLDSPRRNAGSYSGPHRNS